MTALPRQLAATLSHPDAVRYTLVHKRDPRFRWWGIVEVGLACVLLSLLIPLFAAGLFAIPVAAGVFIGLGAVKAAAILAGVLGVFGSVELPHRLLRRQAFRRYRHVIEVVASHPHYGTLASGTIEPRDREHSVQLVATVLGEAAKRHRVVVELVDDPLSCAEVWYGGRPMLAEPGLPALGPLVSLLSDGEDRVELTEEAIEIRRRLPSSGRVLGLLLVLVIPFLAPILWMVRRKPGHALRRAWCDARGKPRWAVFRADPEGMSVWEDAGREMDGVNMPSSELIGITWSTSLASDSSAERLPATLRVVGKTNTLEFGEAFVGKRGFLIRDALVAARLRAHSHQTGRTACPYCGTLYAMHAGVGCPSCGGWPEVLAS